MPTERPKTLGEAAQDLAAAVKEFVGAIRVASPSAARFVAAITRLESLKPKSPWPFPAVRRWWRWR